jgi:hypothetical protein
MRVMCSMLVAAAVACRPGKPAPSVSCDRIAAVLASCTPPTPDDAMASFRDVCPYYMLPVRENAGSNNLAVLVARSIDRCAKAATCEQLTQCLDQEGCAWYMASFGAAPSFQCMGPRR